MCLNEDGDPSLTCDTSNNENQENNGNRKLFISNQENGVKHFTQKIQLTLMKYNNIVASKAKQFLF